MHTFLTLRVTPQLAHRSSPRDLVSLLPSGSNTYPSSSPQSFSGPKACEVGFLSYLLFLISILCVTGLSRGNRTHRMYIRKGFVRLSYTVGQGRGSPAVANGTRESKTPVAAWPMQLIATVVSVGYWRLQGFLEDHRSPFCWRAAGAVFSEGWRQLQNMQEQ